MKTRPFAVFVLVAGLALLALLVLGWTQSTAAAQSQSLPLIASAPTPDPTVPAAAPPRPAALLVAPVPTPEPDRPALLGRSASEGGGAEGPAPALAPDRARVVAALQGAPLMFVENVGQFDAGVRFQVRRGNTTIYLADHALWFTILERGGEGAGEQGSRGAEEQGRRGVNLKLSFPGANPHPRLEPFDRLDTHVSYFTGDDPANRRTDVPAWGGVRYVDLYPGVDLEITSEGGRWTWRLVCGANWQFALRDVRLRVDGADALTLETPPSPAGGRGAGGEGYRLRLTTAAGDFTLPLLQAVDADSTSLNLPSARPEIKGAEIMAPFSSSPSSPRSLSPQDADDFLYGTYLGGSEQDWGRDIAVDGDGDAYIVGMTASDDFPHTTGAFSETIAGGNDAFVAKINPAGNGTADLVYATFMGGSAGDYAHGVAVDGDENVYVTGWSNLGFPDTPGSFAPCEGGGAFVAKLNPTGSELLYGGCIVGFNAEGHDIALDSAGQAYVSGSTGAGFSTTSGAYAEEYNGGATDAFLAIVSSDGVTLTYATYVGGRDIECAGAEGCNIAIDGDGDVYITGDTESDDLPTTAGAYDTTCGTDGLCNDDGSGVHQTPDAFLVKLNPAGNGAADLVYSTYLGGSGCDYACAVAVDGSENAYLTGMTASKTDFPTTSGAFDQDHNGGYGDAFMLKLNPAGSDLVYSAYLGGGGPGDYGKDIAVDGEGNAYAVGKTDSSNFPVTDGAFDTTLGGTDAYVVKVNADGSDLAYATFLGGSGSECGNGCAIAVDGSGNVYATGDTGSDADDFPTSEGAYDRTYNGAQQDAFMVRLPTQTVQYQIYLPLTLRNY